MAPKKTMTLTLTKAHLAAATVALDLYAKVRTKLYETADLLALSATVKQELEHCRVYAVGAVEAVRKATEELTSSRKKAVETTFYNEQARGLAVALDLLELEVKKVVKKQHAIGVDKAVDTESLLGTISELRADLDEQLGLFPALKIVRDPEPEAGDEAETARGLALED